MATFQKYRVNSSPTRTPLSRHQRVSLGTLLLNPIGNDLKMQLQKSSLRWHVKNEEGLAGRNTLIGLLLSTNPCDMKEDDHRQELCKERKHVEDDLLPYVKKGRDGRRVKRGITTAAAASPGLRLRFLRRAWHPVLIAIPEGKSTEDYY